jgi:hypothetical protein
MPKGLSKIFGGLIAALPMALPALSKTGSPPPAAGGFSEVQGLTLSGWLMLIPGLIVGAVILWLAITAPLWRHRNLHHW